MGTIIAQKIVDQAETVLQDTTNVRWPAEELLDWLNLGQRAIVQYAPDANAVTENVKLAPGTKQEIPASGIRLIDVIRNVAVANHDQTVRAIRQTDRRFLDAQRPDWHAEDPDPVVKHFMFDERTPRVFWVYPPQPAASRYVELSYSASPADVSLSNPISLDDVYAGALLDYILYRAYSKDADYAANASRMDYHRKAFLFGIKGKEAGDQVSEPSIQQQP